MVFFNFVKFLFYKKLIFKLLNNFFLLKCFFYKKNAGDFENCRRVKPLNPSNPTP